MRPRIAIAGTLTLLTGVLLTIAHSSAQQSLSVRVNRWLQVSKVSGQVTYSQRSASRRAQIGDFLRTVGDGVATGQKSEAVLTVDTGIGIVDVSESTKLTVQELSFAPDNGRITRLRVTQGQARLRVRPFTHKGSRLEIITPASLSGVRGTDFGVAVQPNGKTGLAVLNGNVRSAAKSQSQSVSGGFQNFTIPGEVPSPPVPLTNNTDLNYKIERMIQGVSRKVRLIGQVDPVNNVVVDGTPQVTDRNGRFVTELRDIPNSFAVQVIVITPLGAEKSHIVTIRR